MQIRDRVGFGYDLPLPGKAFQNHGDIGVFLGPPRESLSTDLLLWIYGHFSPFLCPSSLSNQNAKIVQTSLPAGLCLSFQ